VLVAQGPLPVGQDPLLEGDGLRHPARPPSPANTTASGGALAGDWHVGVVGPGSILGVEVRAAEPEDAADLAEVHADTWVATYVGNVPEDVASVRVARARDRDWKTQADLRVQLGGGVLVLVDDGSVVGFCEFGPTEDEDDDPSQVGHIMRIFIRPAHQGRGGGKLLMAAACEHMARQGVASATLWTPEDRWNHRALDFYRHLGWTQEEVRAPGGDIRHRLVLQ
jgi:GNAT superfamily N-acetyltransferase